MQFGIALKPDISIERIVGLTKQAESAGFEYGWIFDSHVLWKEPYPLLTLMATNTQRMRLGTRHKSRDSRLDRDRQLVCHPQPDFRRTYGTWDWPWRQFPACDGQKARKLVAAGSRRR